MLLLLRALFVCIYSVIVCVFGCLWCCLTPRNPRHVATFAHAFGWLHNIFGIRVESRKFDGADNIGNAIYIANHQNNYDMITAANMVQPPTVTVGKKSLVWVPFLSLIHI